MASEVQPPAFRDISRGTSAYSGVTAHPASGNSISHSKFADNHSPWSRSISIWDRDPAHDQRDGGSRDSIAPTLHTPSAQQGSAKLSDSRWDSQPATQPKLSLRTGAGDARRLTTLGQPSSASSYKIGSLFQPATGPEPQCPSGETVSSRRSIGDDTFHESTSKALHANMPLSAGAYNNFAFRANVDGAGLGPDGRSMGWGTTTSLQRQPPQAPPVFKHFNEFLPKTSVRTGFGAHLQGSANVSWTGLPSPVSPCDMSHNGQSGLQGQPATSVARPDSDSGTSSLTNGFETISLREASSRSSFSRHSPEHGEKYVHVRSAEAAQSMEKPRYLQDSRDIYGRSRNIQDESTNLEWRRGAASNAQFGSYESRVGQRPMNNFEPRGSLSTDPWNDSWMSRQDQHQLSRNGRGMREQNHSPFTAGQYFPDQQGLSQWSNPYIYRMPIEGTNQFQFFMPAPNFQHMVPMNMVGPRQVIDLDATHSVRSVLLDEFKNDKGGRRWELRDVYDHIVEFCGDQAGSKFIQGKLETANSEERDRVFREILPNACQLMCDVFGNYVMQRFFIHGDQSQKRVLGQQMQGKVHSLAKQMYGCRVLQKALKHVLVEQQSAMVCELDGKILELIKDQNGNHVIQKVIKRVPWIYIPFVIDTCVQNLQQLAVHRYGCRVVQRLLRHYDGPLLPVVLRELHSCAQTLITDEFGNYVTQHIIQAGAPEDRAKMMAIVRGNLVSYAKQKFASNVVEKCIIHGNEEHRRDIMIQLGRRDEFGETPLTFMIKDNYGNYVIQKLLDVLDDKNYSQFVAMLEPEISKIKLSLPNKQAENVFKKMLRFEQRSRLSHAGPQDMHANNIFQPRGQINGFHETMHQNGLGASAYARMA